MDEMIQKVDTHYQILHSRNKQSNRMTEAEDKKVTEMKEEITNFMKKKDYYQILGVDKTASDNDIKKAYRTLALRFHPDKNSVEGAKEVFKKVSHAYSTLVDPQKRQTYNQYGAEEDRNPPQRNHRHHEGDQDFDEMDEIFRTFFGGVPARGQANGRYQTYSFNFGNNNGGQQRGGFNLSFVFVIFFLIYSIIPLFQAGPTYSLNPSSTHQYKTITSTLHVEFYASQDYFQDAKDHNYKKQSEKEIQLEYMTLLDQNCELARRQKQKLQALAYRESPGVRRENYLLQAKNTDLAHCRALNQIKEENPDYIRELYSSSSRSGYYR